MLLDAMAQYFELTVWLAFGCIIAYLVIRNARKPQ